MLKKTQKKPKPLHQRVIRHLRAWHRKLGIITALFLIFLASSGIIINHANDLSLDTKKVHLSWLLNYYGIKAPSDVRFYAKNKIAITDNMVWLELDENNNKLLTTTETPVVAAARFQSYFLIATQRQLFLYSLQGELIDQLDSASGVPENITNIAIDNTHLLLKTSTSPQSKIKENTIWQTDADFIDWQISAKRQIHWVLANSFSDSNDIKQQAILRFKAQFLTWEQVLLDVHSGRIFSKFGVLFSDIIALFIILLSVSGIYIWLRYANNKR